MAPGRIQQQNDWKILGMCGLLRDEALFDDLFRTFFASKNLKENNKYLKSI